MLSSFRTYCSCTRISRCGSVFGARYVLLLVQSIQRLYGGDSRTFHPYSWLLLDWVEKSRVGVPMDPQWVRISMAVDRGVDQEVGLLRLELQRKGLGSQHSMVSWLLKVGH